VVVGWRFCLGVLFWGEGSGLEVLNRVLGGVGRGGVGVLA
jgi:hypothetical protein